MNRADQLLIDLWKELSVVIGTRTYRYRDKVRLQRSGSVPKNLKPADQTRWLNENAYSEKSVYMRKVSADSGPTVVQLETYLRRSGLIADDGAILFEEAE